MENYINLLKEKEEELNNICKQKGFELTIVDKGEYSGNRLGEIHIQRLNNVFPTNFIIKIKMSFGVSHIDIIDNNNIWVEDININDIPKWVYNYLNYDKVQFVCNFIGGRYEGQTLNRKEIENISLKPINVVIPKVNESECSPFENIIKYIPIVDKYPYMKRPKVDFGTIYYTYMDKPL